MQAAIRQQLRDRREQLLKAAYYEVVRNEAKVDNYMADDLLKLKEPVFRLRPTIAFGLAEKTFSKSATRWIFP